MEFLGTILLYVFYIFYMFFVAQTPGVDFLFIFSDFLGEPAPGRGYYGVLSGGPPPLKYTIFQTLQALWTPPPPRYFGSKCDFWPRGMDPGAKNDLGGHARGGGGSKVPARFETPR